MRNLLFFWALCFLLPAHLGAQASQTRRLTVPGALLDDYEVSTPGAFTMTWSAYYSRLPAGDDRTVPGVDLELGLTPWLDLSASASLARSRFEQFRITSTGDSYISAKLRVLKEGRRRPGVAFQPVLEVLGRTSLANNLLTPDKVNGVLGGIVGKSFDYFRVYNHSGYFTRGIFFSSAAVELTTFSRITPVAFLTFGALTSQRDVAASVQANASRPDVGGTLGFRLSKNWSGYVTGGHSIGRRDLNSSDYHLGGGLSYTIRLWGTQ